MKHSPELQVVTWQDIRSRIVALNPEFARLVDEVDPGDEYKLIVVRYPYGSNILHRGKTRIPYKCDMLAIDDERLPVDIRKELSLSTTLPQGIVLEKCVETYIEVAERVILNRLISPGNLFALSILFHDRKTCHTGNVWSLNAGSRAVFMLPKVSDMAFHKRLRRDYMLTSGVPSNLFEQGVLFHEIANSPAFNQTWECEVAFLGYKWVEKLRDGSWPKLGLYLLRKIWNGTQFWRDLPVYEPIISQSLTRYHQKLNPYIVDTAKHLMAIAAQDSTGHQVAIDDSVAPVSGIQKAYIESYGLKHYAPIVMQPSYLNPGDENAVYYSLQYPTLTEATPTSRKVSTKLDDLRELKQLLYLFTEEVGMMRDMIGDTPLETLLDQVKIQYYHSDNDRFGEILPAMNLAATDARLKSQLQKFPGRQLSERAQFLRGCVRVALEG